ncbi:hypothetical protein AMECASPLE_017239 [Ameca splendens]|uniref:Uncharacterized protein n=1 Tax=Ameca splendens TaxID=208324 RepID=A0ABV0YPC2_9TELE
MFFVSDSKQSTLPSHSVENSTSTHVYLKIKIKQPSTFSYYLVQNPDSETGSISRAFRLNFTPSVGSHAGRLEVQRLATLSPLGFRLFPGAHSIHQTPPLLSHRERAALKPTLSFGQSERLFSYRSRR